jgi:Glycosyl transferases group 1
MNQMTTVELSACQPKGRAVSIQPGKDKVRIAQLAPLAESVPPKLYGGTERVVSWLTDELVDLGHDVTLFASGDSRTSAKLVPPCPRALRLSRPRPNPAAACAVLLAALAPVAAAVSHHPARSSRLAGSAHSGAALCRCSVRLDLTEPARAGSRPELAGDHYHGLPPDLLKLSERPEGYLAFLGRISPEKGPDIAIRVAYAAKLPLRIAATLPRTENRYFNATIKPLLDQDNVEFVGEVNDRQKQAFLGNAAALLFPIDWPEPFGLVMIEAMATGTPVIAWSRGSVPEVVEDGVTGFIVQSEEEAVAAIGQIRNLDRRHIRERFDERFTARRMAEEYVASYRMLISMSQSQTATKGKRTGASTRSEAV